MKNFFIFFVCACSCALVLAQTPAYSLKNTFPLEQQKETHTFKTYSNSSIKQRLDSIEYFSGASSVVSKSYFQYYNSNSEIIETSFDNSTGVWALGSQKKYNYNTANELILMNTFIWDGTTWNNMFRNHYTYDNGLLTFRIDSTWDNSTGWNSAYKYENTYDSNQNLSTATFYYWFSNQWWGEKDEYTYDTTHKIVSKLQYNWDNSTNLWQEAVKIDYSYDNNQKPILLMGYLWQNNQWDFFNRMDIYYDTNGDRILDMYYDYNGIYWIDSYKNEYIYDNLHNVIGFTSADWDTTSAQWINVAVTEYDFNTLYAKNDLIVPSEYTLYSYDMKTPYAYMLTQMREAGNTATYYYEQYNSSEISSGHSTQNEFSLSPNPATDFLQISFPDGRKNQHINLGLYDMQGKKVMEMEVLPQQMISTRMLPTGLYLYQIKADDNMYHGKIILK